MTQPPPTPKAIVTDAMRRLEKACRLSESRYENEIPLTANVPDALLIDVRAVLNAVNPEASEIMWEALQAARTIVASDAAACAAFAAPGETSEPGRILKIIDEALSSICRGEREGG
jgi:hypothetical protein